MNKIYNYILVVCCSGNLLAQEHCIDGRYDTPVFSTAEIEVTSGVVYGSAENLNGNLQELLMDVYRPYPELDEVDRKPVFMFVHGGGLLGGDRFNAVPVYLCTELAKRGYVAVSIDYRLGWYQTGDCQGDTASLQLARYRADQDVRAAVRYLKEESAGLGIDTQFIFLGGASVGASLSLYTAFGLPSDYTEAQQVLGALDSSGNPYYNHTIDIAGVMGSGVGIQQAELVTRKDIPILCFHGTCDFTVPYRVGPLFDCYEPVRYWTYYGSRYLTELKRDAGFAYKLYTNERGDHGAVDTTTLLQETLPFFKEILCGEQRQTEVYEYHNNGCVVQDKDSVVLNILPNPVTDQFMVDMRSGISGEVRFTLIDVQGKRVLSHSQDFLAPIDLITLPWNAATLARGLYWIEVQNGEAYGVFPVVVQ